MLGYKDKAESRSVQFMRQPRHIFVLPPLQIQPINPNSQLVSNLMNFIGCSKHCMVTAMKARFFLCSDDIYGGANFIEYYPSKHMMMKDLFNEHS